MIPFGLDPTQFTALQSLTFGDVLSADGRAHPLDALTPVSVVQVPATVIPAGTSTGPAIDPSSISQAGIDMTDVGKLFNLSIPKHLGSRIVIGLIAVIIVAIVVFRLTL